MFTLDVNMLEVNSMLFMHGKGVGDIGIWHNRVGHVDGETKSCWKFS
jgi:hypothetical protein